MKGRPSLLEIYEREARRDPGMRPILFRAVAERVRARFDPADAEIVSRWFEELAAGADAGKVFPSARKRGAPKGRKRGVDEVDLVHIALAAIDEGCSREEALRRVAEVHGIKLETVKRIFRRWAKELEPLHRPGKK